MVGDSKDQDLKKNIYLLSWTSFFEDTSSQMNYPILPLFLTNVLGVNKTFVGLIEGIAETTASFLKIFFGWLSDKLKTRKVFIVAGYAIAGAVRPFLSLASKGAHVLGIRFIDRVGKGTRTSPRDALIADSCPERDRGRAFGLHRAMDTAGAVVGPLLAFLFLYFWKISYRNIFLISVIPIAISVVIVSLVKEKKSAVVQTASKNAEKAPLKIGLPPDFKKFLLIAGIFTLGNSSDAFLILRAGNTGVNPVLIPLLWLLFNATYAVSSLPSGILSDRIGSRRVILYGYLIYAGVYFGFAFASSQFQVWLLFLIYGFYYGLTDGVSRSFVSRLVSSEQRATAFGIYHSMIGFIALPASLIMGFLWDWKGVKISFGFGAFLALISSVLLFTLKLRDFNNSEAG